MSLILASSSSIRKTMLDQAGVDYRAVPAGIDERAQKSLLNEPRLLATALAQAKALAVSSSEPGAWVIGSDSVVSAAGRLFDKPADRDEASAHLRFFSGKTLELTSAVALAREGAVDWSSCDSARLKVRELSDAFIDDYLEAEWPEVGYCVGVFRLEGRGVQLFEDIDGSYFTILGMPLLPLLNALRTRRLIPQ
jgi:septum formation protein